MNVISYTWLLSCLERGFLVDLEPMFMVSTNKQLQQYFDTSLDSFGDHFTQPVEPGRLRDILNKIPDEALSDESASLRRLE